ncbi:hypothetical protein D5086_030381 [Populus alba]|uniref:Uncharacterized protein n=1 Tax=Populus alba TaxID=43335 RepID=A0ACC4ANE2_POPAL
MRWRGIGGPASEDRTYILVTESAFGSHGNGEMIAFQRKLQVDNGVSHTLSFINDDIETREMNLSSKCHRTELLIARKRLSDLFLYFWAFRS